MIHIIVSYMESIFIPMGAWGVFLSETLDGLFVFIPSTAIFLVAGFFFLKGPLSWVLIKTMIIKVVIEIQYCNIYIEIKILENI